MAGWRGGGGGGNRETQIALLEKVASLRKWRPRRFEMELSSSPLSSFAARGTGAVWVFSRVSSGGYNGDLRHREGSGRQHKAPRLGPGVSDVVVTPSTSLFRL